ncbi:MAG: XRE family transcriptional regulator [Rhodospirillaceae bacterium]|nr:XRE family transcriptional regulator [Rhodospirillaceae bacterium]
MTTTLREKMKGLSAERRARIDAETDRLHDEYKTLQELRKARDLTQVEIAKALNVRQSSVAQMEKRSDLLISTLRGYVEGMGGTLKLVVEFPDRAPMQLAGIGELGDGAKTKDSTCRIQS